MTTTLSIPEADFWRDPRRTQTAVSDRLLDDGFRGVLVDAPRSVETTRRDRLPLVLARAATYAELRGPSFEERAILVGVRLPSNQTCVGRAFPLKESLPRPPRSGKPPRGALVSVFDTDARAQLPGLPWRRGEVVLTVIFRDQVSNRVTTALTADGVGLEDDPAVQRFLARQDAAFPQPVWPPEGEAARWGPPEGAQDPEGPGLHLEVERSVVVPRRGDARCVLRGAIHVPFRPRYVVRPDPGEEAQEAEPTAVLATDADERAVRELHARRLAARALGLTWQDPGDPAATAVVPLTVVVVPADGPEPRVFPLQVPVRAPLDATSPPEALVAHLEVDLLALPRGRGLVGGTSFLYAFSDALMVGPLTTTVLREEDLRP